ncbi:MAG: DUF1080 domain-containing protein [Candidatus Hydrogenedentes bacterium]|nr:DUF1080 domain-containing protein [Candidatus Hydrogenedentota bacterium]
MKKIIFMGVVSVCLFYVVQSFAESPFFKEFFVMDTATRDAEHTTPLAQVKLAKELGFSGISWTGLEHISELKEALQSEGVKLYAVYVWGNVEKEGVQLQPGVENAVELLGGDLGYIWLTINSKSWSSPDEESNAKALELVKLLADIAGKFGVKVALYPHAGSWLEKVDHAYQLAQDSGKDNVGVSFNLCHWLKVESPDANLDLALRKVATKLFVVTLNGAEPPGDWDKLIQPLDKGSYDLKPLLKTLKSIGFTGAIGLQGYGIQEPAKEHLPRSISVWKELVKSVADFEPVRISTDSLDGFREHVGDWYPAGGAIPNPADEKLLIGLPGVGVLINGKDGKTTHLITKEEFGDIELHVEFMVPKGSNSGVYIQGRYEIQVLDSWGVKEPKHSDCGGIYQRWREEPGIPDNERGFEGRPPRVNASRPPGVWQSFDIVFRAPRFDQDGNKIENAKFIRVVHNGVVIHENEELSGPTRASLFNNEAPLGPIMFQGDHGPVAYRNIWVRQIK